MECEYFDISNYRCLEAKHIKDVVTIFHGLRTPTLVIYIYEFLLWVFVSTLIVYSNDIN